MNETDKKSGKPDKPQKSRLNLWISDKTSESLDTLAKERGVSASSIAETALRLYLERDRVYREAEKSRQAYLNELLTEITAADVQAILSAVAKQKIEPGAGDTPPVKEEEK